MTEIEAQEQIRDLPVGSKLEVIKTNGDIIGVILASHKTHAIEEKRYERITVPEQPPAITVYGKRWGVFRIELDQIVNIAHVGEAADA